MNDGTSNLRIKQIRKVKNTHQMILLHMFHQLTWCDMSSPIACRYWTSIFLWVFLCGHDLRPSVLEVLSFTVRPGSPWTRPTTPDAPFRDAVSPP